MDDGGRLVTCWSGAFPQAKYVINYAYMPNKSIPVHPWMVQLPVALRARMDISGHTQKDVEATTGVSQSQISRALNGKRKRPTEAMQKLCRYANLEIKNESASALAELYALLQQVIAGGPAAAACVKGVLESLVPLLENPARYKRKK